MTDLGDVCDVCEAPATFWRRHGEPVDRCDRHAPSAENILLDLIADLRADGVGHAEDNFMLGQCKSCEERWPCVLVQHADMAVRAEARLREVTGDE